jgi:DNA-binding response OmpR family regulator
MEIVKKILVVEDELSIRSFIAINLLDSGYDVTEVENGEQAMKIAPGLKPDLVVLDIMMKGIDGFQVCKWLRTKFPEIGILLLSAKNEDMDKVLGLELGADDYMVKPFNPLELLARIKAIFRRQELLREYQRNRQTRIKWGAFELDIELMRCSKHGVAIELTPKEFLILKFLMQNPDKPFTRDELLDLVWGNDFFGDNKIVDVNIRRLREKIEEQPSLPVFILTVRGYGYRWTGVSQFE